MTSPLLPNEDYPFADQRFPLSEMAMMEAPVELEQLLKKAAEENGVEIVRDDPVELTCGSQDFLTRPFSLAAIR